MSAEFKDLIIRMFSYNGADRPSVEDIRNHAWMQQSFKVKDIRNNILSELAEKRSQETNTSSEEREPRGDKMLDLVK